MFKFHFCFSLLFLFLITNQIVAQPNKKDKPPVAETPTTPIENKDTKPITPQNEFDVTQVIANDLNFRGSSVLGEKLARRNLQPYESFSNAWLISSNVAFILPATGFKLFFTSNNPIENRGNRDTDFRYQSSPGGTDQTSTVIRDVGRLTDTKDPASITYDPNAVRMRREQNGLRDSFTMQLYYDWETKAGGFRTGMFYLNNQNYPSRFNLGEFVLGWKFPFLKFLNPALTTYYRFTSDTGSAYHANIHFRFTMNHEFNKGEFFRFTPSVEAGYQTANNTTDRRTGATDVTTKLQFNFGHFLISFTDVYRPDTYMYDNDRTYPKIGKYSDINPADGRTVDPSKSVGLINNLVLDQISKLNTIDVGKMALTQSYQEQKIVKHIYIVQIGYNKKF
ncbi:MAG: hypothetical protein HS129_10525 [Leptospiraceae bacterium]|nr:hypothetical protein [Leptospiraceae bacterium]NUM40569.1 hypothetical protein [Leptospiraceae bacterium]